MLNKKQVLAQFKDLYPKLCQNPCTDKPMRDQAWNDYVDGLLKDGQVHARAYNWTHPFTERKKK
jgi:hypothetical protein